MLLKTIVSFILILSIYGCGGANSYNKENTSPIKAEDKNISTIKFKENSSINIGNPDRGFYSADYELNKDKNYNMFKGAKEDGYNLVYAPLNLKDYNETSTLPNRLIDTIKKNLNDANSSGVKLIFRIKYRDSIKHSSDPKRSIVMAHLKQLKPILQKYKNIISVVQAGNIGAWGEWHSFTGDYADSNTSYKANRREIIEKLVDIFPDKYIQIRTPMHKEQLFGTSVDYGDEGTEGEITPQIAYSNDIRAKIGYHNDCVLANKTDMGTYPSNDIDFWKNYVINDSKYAPIGGETCGIGDGDDASLSSCPNALKEFKRLRYSYLNDVYHPDVLKKWKDQGCYQEIKENLGYRLVAKELTIEKKSNSLSLLLSIENRGYASPYIKSNVNFILKNDKQAYTFHQDIDMRKFYPKETKKIKDNLSLDGIPSGNYCLYLQIGEGYSAIRLSNSNLWEEKSKTNKLTCSIKI